MTTRRRQIVADAYKVTEPIDKAVQELNKQEEVVKRESPSAAKARAIKHIKQGRKDLKDAKGAAFDVGTNRLDILDKKPSKTQPKYKPPPRVEKKTRKSRPLTQESLNSGYT